jgi:conserved oligomeric Golgi complex subunit 6
LASSFRCTSCWIHFHNPPSDNYPLNTVLQSDVRKPFMMASVDPVIDTNHGGNVSSSQNSILSSKVSRALEVRSDTPAMKAALEALAHLPDHQDDLFTVDSRSVRVAIEQDALHQALLLQNELKGLVETVRELKKGVSETAAIARRIDEVIHFNVVSPGAKGSVPVNDSPGDLAESNSGLLSGARDSSDAALEEEQKLSALLSDCFARRNLARKRLEAVHEFLERFDLSEEDSRLLDHYAFEDVEASHVNGIAFLNALERVRTIRLELGQTFGSLDMLHQHKSSQRISDFSAPFLSDANRLGASSALRMMETLAQKQERAYERLYHWLQKYLHLHSHGQQPVGLSSVAQDEDMLDEVITHPFVRRSLKTLRNVPAFYSHLLELIALSRRSEETHRFLLALTSGYGGLPPIEMRAHDSIVYVGDMLAFCFRAFSVEADVARSLLNFEPEVEENGMEDDADQDEKEEVKLAEEDPEYFSEKPITPIDMLNQSTGGLARPLKSRILQVVSTLARRPDEDDIESDDGINDLDEEGVSTRAQLAQLYELCGLLLFYSSALEKAIGKLGTAGSGVNPALPLVEKNPLVAAILECLEEATNAYEASLRVYGAMLEQLQVLTGDSEASLAHAMIARIVDVRKTSPGFVPDVECPATLQHLLSLDWSCDVLLEAALPSCKTLDDTVTLKQSISIARQGNLTDEVMQSLEEKVRQKEASLIDLLVEKETNDVLDLCGLSTLVRAWERFKSVQVEGMIMASYPGLTPDEAESSLKEFYSSLYSPPIPSFEKAIKDPTLRKLARVKIADKVCQNYAALYDTMSQQDGGYDDLTFLCHTPQQVATLFSG